MKISKSKITKTELEEINDYVIKHYYKLISNFKKAFEHTNIEELAQAFELLKETCAKLNINSLNELIDQVVSKQKAFKQNKILVSEKQVYEILDLIMSECKTVKVKSEEEMGILVRGNKNKVRIERSKVPEKGSYVSHEDPLKSLSKSYLGSPNTLGSTRRPRTNPLQEDIYSKIQPVKFDNLIMKDLSPLEIKQEMDKIFSTGESNPEKAIKYKTKGKAIQSYKDYPFKQDKLECNLL